MRFFLLWAMICGAGMTACGASDTSTSSGGNSNNNGAGDGGNDSTTIVYDHILAFSAVDSTWRAQTTNYSQVFNTTDTSPITYLRIIIADAPDLCADFNASISPPNHSRLLLEGYIDGNQTIPTGTWTHMGSQLPADTTQLDLCKATFFAYDANGIVVATTDMTQGSVTFTGVNNPNARTLGVSYNLVPDLAVNNLSLQDPNFVANNCGY